MESHKTDYALETKLIHAGGDHVQPKRALNPPIFLTSTFTFENTHDAQQAFSLESDDYIYTRLGNPTINQLEERMAAIEGGKGAVAFASGMAAISTVLLSLLEQNDSFISHFTTYGCTYALQSKVLPRYGIKPKLIDLQDLDNLKKNIDDTVKVIYFETPANPNLVVLDIEGIVKIAKEKNIKVVVDNTFATPYATNPLKLGADVVVHSATKYICGHGDTIAGIAIANDSDYITKLKLGNLKEFGGCISPFNAWLLLRGLKTLGIRVRQQTENATKIATYLEKHPKVEKVNYPGLPSHKGHEIAKKQMKHFGAMLSFNVKGTFDEAVKLCNSVKLMSLAVSLGDCETLIQIPSAMTHSGYNQEQLEEFGLSKTMVRISVGLEDADDLINDLDQAFNSL